MITIPLTEYRLRRTDDGYGEVVAVEGATPTAAGGGSARSDGLLLSEEMQPALEKTTKALLARRRRRRAGGGGGQRGRPRRIGGDSTGKNEIIPWFVGS